MNDLPNYFQTLGSIIEKRASSCGDKTFIQYEEGEEITYREVDEITNRIANGLIGTGIKKGDRVAIFLPNSLECLYAWFGISKAGAIDVPINLANKGYFLSHQIDDSGAKTIIIEQDLIPRLKLVENDLPKLEKVVVWSKSRSKEQIPTMRFRIIDYDDLKISIR